MARHSELTVVERSTIYLVGQQIVATLKEVLEEGAGQKLKQAVLPRASELKNRIGSDTYLMEIYPANESFTNQTPFTTFIGFAVTDLDHIPEGMVSHTLPASRYAKTTHFGKESELSDTYGAIFQSELQQGGFDYKFYHFEQWDDRFEPESDACEIDIYFAVK